MLPDDDDRDDDALEPTADNLAPLVVILRAAVLSGDRRLERSARRELRLRYGVAVEFLHPESCAGVPHAN
jgi:hypothetical protein